MSIVRGVILSGKFRTHHELNGMSADDQRNTLITELVGRTNRGGGPLSALQSLDDKRLAGLGAALVFLRDARIRTDQQLRLMSDDDIRNTAIVEINAQTNLGGALQAWNNLDLVLRALGHVDFGITLQAPTYIRGVLLAGKFRTHAELNAMSSEDMRNTLIVELTQHSNQSNYQSFDDYKLGGAGAAMVFLREARIRDDAALRAMSAEDQRNTLIVEIEAQTHLGIAKLQGLSNIDLIRLGLGVAAEEVFPTPTGPLRPPPSWLQFRLRGFSEHESTDDTAQGASDEVYISAQGMDSATLRIGQDGKATTDSIEAPPIGDVSEDSVRGPWAQNPHVLIEFALDPPVNGPRTFVVTLLIIEHDNADVGDAFNELNEKVGEVGRKAVQTGATAVGAAAGTAILPGVGTAVLGAAAGYLAGEAWDAVIGTISEGLANDIFSPQVLRLVLDPNQPGVSPDLERTMNLRVEEHGAVYDIQYDWHIRSENY